MNLNPRSVMLPVARTVLLLWAAALLLPSPSEGQTAERLELTPGVQSFSHDELVEFGVLHFSDLFWLAEGWTVTSVDGYDWGATAGGEAPADEGLWKIFVDGQPVHLRAMGRAQLDHLPLRVDEVERVQIRRAPGVVAGRMAPFGSIHIFTRIPPDGPSLDLRLTPGSEIGDPGPFEYTGEDDTNVDRKGPLLGATGSFGRRELGVSAGAKIDERHADNFIRPRVRVLCRGDCIFRGAPVLRQTSAHASATADMASSRHQVRGYYSDVDEQLYFDPAGLEIPSATSFQSLAAAGTASLSDRTAFHYQGQLTEHRFQSIGDLPGFDLQDTRRGGFLALEVTNIGTISMEGTWETREAPALNRHTMRTTKMLLHHTSFVGEMYVDAGAELSETNGDLGTALLATISRQVSGSHALSLQTTLNRWPHDRHRAYLTDLSRGLAIAPASNRFDPGTLTDEREHFYATNFSGSLTWLYREDENGFQTELTAGLSHVSDFPLTRTQATPQPDNDGLLTDLTIGNATGTRLLTQATASGPLLSRLHGRAFIAAEPTIGASRQFSDDVANQPTWRGGLALRYLPVPRLSVTSRLLYESATEWRGYEGAASQAPDLFDAAFDARWQLHLTAQKRFWGDRMRASASLRRVLDKPIRYHPAGAPIDMEFFVDVHFRF